MTTNGRHQQRPAQAVVEFALFVTMFAMLLAGAVDFGGAFSAWVTVGNMARAGAQRGTITGLMHDTDPATAMRTAALNELSADSAQQVIFGVAPSVATSGPTADSYGYCMVTVTVSYAYAPLVRFPPIPTSFSMQRTATMRTQIANTVGCS